MWRSIETIQILLIKNFLRQFNKNGLKTPAFRWVESIILKDLSKLNDSENIQKIYSNRLYLNLGHKSNEQNFYLRIQLLWWVLKARGRLRWLCFRLLPRIFSDSYSISRTKFLLKLFIYRADFVDLVLSKLHLAEDESQMYGIVSNYEYTHPDTNLHLTSNQSYMLEENISNKLIFGRRNTWDKNNEIDSILIRLILWNSIYVLNLLRESTLLNQNDKVRNVLHLIPSFDAALQECESISSDFHVNAALSLDERMKVGTKSYDRLSNVKIWHQRFILQNGSWCIIDSTCSPYLDFVGGHWQFLEQTHLHFDHVFMKRPAAERNLTLKNAIFLIGRADENWYHLILDTLPRYLYLKELDKSIPVLIRSDLPPSSINLLKRILEREMILINSSDIVTVEELFFVACRSTAFDSKPTDIQDIVKFSPVALTAFRDWIFSVSLPLLNNTFPEKLLISRRSKYRNLLNAQKVEDEFRKSGFDIINPSNDFYDVQEHYYAKASHLVAPGGAGLTNMVFMQSHSTVTSLVSWRGRGTRLWKKLAEACEINLIELIGVPTNYNIKYMTRLHSNFILPLIIVRRYLKR